MRRRAKLSAAIGLAAAAVLALAGCAGGQPHAVANHDAETSYHASAAASILTEDVLGGLAASESFSSVGYMHGIASSGEALHVQHETSISGATYWSRETSSDAGSTIDRIHVGGAKNTYYLFGDAYLPVTKTPWVVLPEGDIKRDGAGVCRLPSVWYLCGLVLAWGKAYTADPAKVPVHVTTKADGSRQLSSGLSLAQIIDSGIFSLAPGLESALSDEHRNTLLPFNVWLDKDGRVTKAEVNGAIGENPKLELQLGFELLGDAQNEQKPPDPGTIAPEFVTTMTDPKAIDAFWDAIAKIRLSS